MSHTIIQTVPNAVPMTQEGFERFLIRNTHHCAPCLAPLTYSTKDILLSILNDFPLPLSFSHLHLP